MKKFDSKVHGESSIINYLLTLPKPEQKKKYLRKIIKEMKNILKNDYYGKPTTFKFVASFKKMPLNEFRIYFQRFRIYKTIVDSLMEIDHINRKSKLYQIEWIGKPEQLKKFVKRLVDKNYIDENMSDYFRNLFFIKSETKTPVKITYDVDWKESQKSWIYLLVTMASKNVYGKKIIEFKNKWAWIENIFKHKGIYFIECGVQNDKFEKLRDKKKLNMIIKDVYET